MENPLQFCEVRRGKVPGGKEKEGECLSCEGSSYYGTSKRGPIEDPGGKVMIDFDGAGPLFTCLEKN